MEGLLATVIALGIASSFSPVILAISLTLLAGKSEPEKHLFFFLLGGALAALIIALVASAAWGGDIVHADSLAPYRKGMTNALGALCLLFAAVQFLPQDPQKKQRIGSHSFAHLFVLGFLANITNFDAVLLNMTAVREIAYADITTAYELTLIALAAFFYLSPMLVPLLLYVIRPEKTKAMLMPLETFMEKYGRYLVAAVFLVFGIYLLFFA